ncbi:MAG: hypothetical protein JEZ05_03695 [Tenericutes bacterium]|nr:hypothetical protein [Mycoplasmatota bacterium]
MKQRLFTVILLLFASFLLAGCDFGGATTTTTTAATTTAATTTVAVTTTTATTTTAITTTATTTTAITTIPTTTQATTTVTTLAGETYYQVDFYNGDGYVFATQSVLEGAAATTPAGNPTKAATVQYTYTFSHWDQSYTNVTANMQIYPVFTSTVNNYTVRFFEWDNSVIKTETVAYGSSATAPAATPLKPDDGTDTFTFTGWDKPFSNITGNLDVYPVFSGSFNRDLLVAFVDDTFGDENDENFDADEFATELLLLSEFTTDEELYEMLLDAYDLFLELPTISTATDFQTWYADTKTAGMTKELIITLMYNAMYQGMSNDLAYRQEDVAFYTTELAEKAQMKLDYEAQLLAFDAEVVTYCTTGINPLLTTECTNYWAALKDRFEKENLYYNEMNRLYWESYEFNGLVWDDIQNLQFDVFEKTFNGDAQTEIDSAQLALDNYLAELTSTEEGIYLQLLSIYNFYLLSDSAFWSPNFDELYVVDLGGVEFIRNHLDMLFYGDQFNYVEGDIYYQGYVGYTYMLDNVEWSLENITWNLAEAEDRLSEQIMLTGFMTDSLYAAPMKQAMGTLYDGLDAVILTIDQDMFDMVQEMMMSFMVSPQLNMRPTEDMFNPMDLITPENVEFLATKVNSMLTAFYGTLDQTDYDNIKVLLLGYLDDMFEEEGMTPSERTAYLAVIGTTYDKYVLHFQFLVTEVQSFLGSVDQAKVTAIMELIPDMDKLEIMTDINIAILGSKIFDALFGDDSFDISGLLQIAADVYFDVSTELNPDPSIVTSTQTAIATFMTDTFALVDIVKDLNPTYVSEANVENVLELIGRAKAIAFWFIDGFETVGDPLVYYDDDMFDEFVWNFLDADDPSAMLTMLMDAFGTLDTEETYYRARSLFQYAIGILNIQSFEGIQEWVGGLETFGHTQAEWVDYVVNILKYVTEENRDGDNYYDYQMTYLLEQINAYNLQISNINAQIDSLDADVQAEIDLLDSLLQADATSFWVASKQNMLNYKTFKDIEWQLESNLDMMYMPALYDIVQAICDANNPYDETEYNLAMADFNIFLNDHTDNEYVYNLVEEFKDAYLEYLEYDLTTYQPLLTIIQAEPAYTYFDDTVSNNVNEYTYHQMDILYFYQEINWLNESIIDLEESLWFINVVYDLVNDPVNEPLTEEAMNIVMDDLQNMIASMPAGSFELIERLVEMMTATNVGLRMDEPDFYSQDKFEIPFTAEELYAFSQDLSAFLKLRLQTITPTEMLALENYVLVVITEYVSDQGLDPLDEAAEITRLNTLVLKYLGLADEALDELTALLDGLSVASIQGLMDYIDVMSKGGMNIYVQVILGAQVIDELVDFTLVDLTVITGILNELYFDFEIETYLPSDLTDVQTAWAAHVVDVEALITSVAAMNPEMIDPADYAELYELQQKVMYMAYLFMDPEDILSMPSFDFDYQMLVSFVSEMFDESDPTAVDAIILDLLDVFNLGATDFEDLFYIILGVGSVIQGMPDIESPTDLLRVVQGILSMGYTNTEIASFVMNGLMTFLVPQLPSMYDTTDLEAELLVKEGELDNACDALNAINDEVAIEIALIADPAARTAAEDLWNAYNLREEYYAIFDNTINDYSWNNEMFQWWLWYDLEENIINNEDYNYIDNILNNMDNKEREMYQDILNCFGDYMYYENELYWKQNDFNNSYYTVMTSFDAFYEISNYLNDKSYELMSPYMNINWLQNEVNRLEEKIQDIENMAWLPQTLEIMLGDPANVTLTEQVLVILIDQVEAWGENPDINFINSLPMMFEKGMEGLTAAEISAELINAGTFIQVLFGTMDLADEAIIEAWALEFADAFAETQTSDPVELAALQADLAAMISANLSGLLDIPAEIGDFVVTMDETKTQALIDQLMILNTIDDSTPEGEIMMVITISNIINILVGDGSLNYDAIYGPILGIVYDMNTINGYIPLDTLAVMDSTIGTSLDTIIAQAAIVALIDPATTNPLELASIQLLKDTVDDLGDYLDSLFAD